jgi:hypothetical protein
MAQMKKKAAKEKATEPWRLRKGPVFLITNKRGPTFTRDRAGRYVIAAYRFLRDAREVLGAGKTDMESLMDLARVYVGPLNAISLLVPYAWSTWTYQGIKFKRVMEREWQQREGRWRRAMTSVEIIEPGEAKAVILRVIDSETCGKVGASQAPPSAELAPNTPADGGRRSC